MKYGPCDPRAGLTILEFVMVVIIAAVMFLMVSAVTIEIDTGLPAKTAIQRGWRPWHSLPSQPAK